MNAIKNQVQLIGRVGNDPELRSFANGGKMLKLSLATHEIYKDSNGERIEKTQWHTILAWGKTAEHMTRHINKGDQIAISGKLVHRSYEGQDGIKRFITEVVVQEFMLLSQNVVSEAA